MELLNGIVGKLDANEIIKDKCYIALRGIADIVRTRDLSDEEYFKSIEEIIQLLETFGADCGNRHDFG